MGSSKFLDSNSSEISMNSEQQFGFDAAPDLHTDPAQDNSSEEYTDSDDDPNPGLAAGGSFTVDFETEDPIIVEKAREGIQLAIDDFNRKNGTKYELVEILEVAESICYWLVFTLVFVAVDSVDNLLTEFEACVVFDRRDYKFKSIVECEAKSTQRVTDAVDDSRSKHQRGINGYFFHGLSDFLRCNLRRLPPHAVSPPFASWHVGDQENNVNNAVDSESVVQTDGPSLEPCQPTKNFGEWIVLGTIIKIKSHYPDYRRRNSPRKNRRDTEK